MLRNLAALVFLLGACTAVTPVPTPPTLPATAQATAQPTATLAPTAEPPLRIIHRVPRAVGSINVLVEVCKSHATPIYVYEYGVTYDYNCLLYTSPSPRDS